MFILDLNQVMFSTFFVSIGMHTNIKIEQSLMRHMAYNTIRSINSKFRKEHGELIIANDSVNNWRKGVFPHYKASRRKDRENSDLDWVKVFECMGVIKDELRYIFPYKFLEVPGAEADDIIGVICKIPDLKVLIVSGDKDYKQLHNANIKQYDPVNNRYLKEENPKAFLFEHIIRGDVGDGVPNVASPDNCFVIKQKQKSITKKLFESLNNIENDPNNKYYRNYMRNKTLIDLGCTPTDMCDIIKERFAKENKKDRSLLLQHFSKCNLKKLTEQLGDF